MTWKNDATTLLAGFADGSLDAEAVMAETLSRIDSLDPVLNAYSARSDSAMGNARDAAARWRSGDPAGPLDGLPVIIKDNLVSAGLPAAWGNAELARRVCDRDETPVARLRKAGAIVLGKGNTPEFAVEGYTDNLTFGVTRNPFDPALTPGGSSGGVVAAVAAGMAFAGIGTDGGGSIRRPAGYTGLCGLKPGIGHVARGGGLAQVLLDFEVVGPIARSVRDLALLDAVLSGTPSAPVDTTPARILAVARMPGAPCDPEIIDGFDAAVAALRSQGHAVDEAPLPYDLGALNALWTNIGEIGLARYFAEDPAVGAVANPKYRAMAERGAAAPATLLYEICDRVFALREAARTLWGYDAILTPASAAHPWPATEAYPPVIDGQEVGPRGHAVYTGWVNAAGLPALAFPAPVSGTLPVGLQLIGPMASEAWLLAMGGSIAPPFRWPDMALRSD